MGKKISQQQQRRHDGLFVNIFTAIRGPLFGILLGYLIFGQGGYKHSSLSSSVISTPGRILNVGASEHSIVESSATGEASKENHHSEEEKEDEEEEEDPTTDAITVVCIILLLILLTIGFEETKEWVEESANRNMRPIIDSLFAEMTVLGFLSVFTFVITKMGFFEQLSLLLFGEKEQLQEIFEIVHYALFFIMIFFVAQVLVLVKEAMQTEEKWLEMDRKARDEVYMEKIMRKRDVKDTSQTNRFVQYVKMYVALLPLMRDVKQETIEDEIMFAALREEFILDRSFDPPHDPVDISKRLDSDFNFGRYLSMCLGKTLYHVVHVDVLCWVFFAVFTILFFVVELLVDNNMCILSWVWVGIGWALFLFNVHFEHHFIYIRNAYVPSVVHMTRSSATYYRRGSNDRNNNSSSGSINEKTALRRVDSLTSLLEDEKPDWCKIDMDIYMASRSIYKKLILGSKRPAPQHTLFWFERKGGKASILILQINLVFIGIYCAMLLLTFIPTIHKEYGITIMIVYLLISAVPVLSIFLNKQHLVATMSQVISLGALRHPKVIADVVREAKTARVVRSFIIVYKLHRAAATGFKMSKASTNSRKPHYTQLFDRSQINELGKTFDSFDKSGDGNISSDEFAHIMESLGVKMDEEKVSNMIEALDEDGDGEVSKEEFLQWYADQQQADDDETMKERAHFLFKLFDQDGSGEISVGEFKSTLEAFNIDFTVDEVGELVKELDEDGNGMIGEEEFEELLEKYYPKEMDLNVTERSHRQIANIEPSSQNTFSEEEEEAEEGVNFF